MTFTSQRRNPPPRTQARQPDPTEADLRELAVVFPRLEAALGSDGAGPSDPGAGGGRGGGSKSAPLLIDLDTNQARTLIESGAQQLAAEVRKLLNMQAPTAVLYRLRAQLRAELRQADAEHAGEIRATAVAVVDAARHLDPADLSPVQRLVIEDALATIIAINARLRPLRELAGRIALIEPQIEHRASTLGVLEAMPAWYAQLRSRHHPLADRIARQTRSWRHAAREALNLQTREQPLGYQCPHHPDEPTELVRDRDEAVLSPAVLAGSHPRWAPPLEWRRAQSVHCPHCKTRWNGAAQLRTLMLMIEQARTEDLVDGMTEAIAAAIDDEHLAVVLYRCNSCGGVSSRDAWAAAWNNARLDAGVELEHAEITGVCPRCGHVHQVDELEQLAGVAVVRPEQENPNA